MKFAYESFILRRFADGRIFFVNPKMPFEYFIDCFHNEQPFFLVSMLEDGRIAITPNALVIPFNFLQAGFWPRELFPTGYEYVAIKNGSYPLIVTAHPITAIEQWFRKFEKLVSAFAKETLAEFVTSSGEMLPLDFERIEKFEKTPAMSENFPRRPVGV